jgi:hypothetical protein
MATITRTFFVDDLDGSTEDVENVQISLDGTNFEIDLSAANAGRLREKLARYVDQAPVSRRRRPAGPGESSNLRHQDGTRCKPSAIGPGRTGTRCRPAGASRRASRTPSPPPTDTGTPLPLKRFT